MTDREKVKELKNMLEKIIALTYDSHIFSPHTCTVCNAVMGIGVHDSNCIVKKAIEMTKNAKNKS